MNDERPYKEFPPEQLNDLPLPNEEQSWQEMKKLLDKDDDDRKAPPIWLKGCAGWIVGLGLLVILWFVFKPHEWFSGKKETATREEKTATPANPSSPKQNIPPITDTNTRNPNQVPVPGTPDPRSEPSNRQPVPPAEDYTTSSGRNDARTNRTSTTSSSSQNPAVTTPSTSTDRQAQPSNRQPQERPRSNKGNPGNNRPRRIEPPVVKQNKPAQPDPASQVDTAAGDAPVPPVEQVFDKPVPPADTISSQPPSDTSLRSKEKEKANEKERKPKDKVEKNYYWSAGLSLQQAIPLAGQKATPYNYYGRKGSLADYVPSVYVRFNREKKWFVQTEFRYGAPQSVKETIYATNVQTDSSGTISTTRSLRLKKTFFHQLPVSFNYYVLPNWSIGTGIMYSRFHSAVSEEVVRLRNGPLQIDSVLVSKIVQVKPGSDSTSSFTNSQLHVLFETQYQWKRFSLGLRYTQGLQPFIRYTDPNGILQEQKNRSLQAFLRFQLWKSK
jgi:hypothetical protein